MSRSTLISCAFLFVFACGLNFAATLLRETEAAEPQTALPTHAIVPGFERFPPVTPAEHAASGAWLLGELGCVACHASDDTRFERKQAPILDQVGSRVRPSWIREFLANPHAVKPGTTMPDPWAGVPEEQKRPQIEALTHYLMSTGVLAHSTSLSQAVKRGDDLYHQVGCVACHDPRRADSPALPDSMPLGDLSKKYSVPSLTQFLTNPLAVRPSGRMPALNLKPEEARDLAAFLLKGIQVPANVRYEYFEGSYDKLPNFSELRAKSSGTSAGFDLTVGRRDQFAMRFTGFLQIAQEDTYQFHLASDDGSQLRIDGRQVAIVDGVHPLTWGMGRAKLAAGPHEVVIEYFEGGGEEELKVEIESPKLPRQSIESLMTLERTPPRPAEGESAFTLDTAKAQQGKQLFGQLGCVRCHALGGPPQPATVAANAPASDSPAAAPKRAPELAKLKSTGGCLSETPVVGAPRYVLSPTQRAALTAALGAHRATPAEKKEAPSADAAEARIEQTLLRMNCYACHARGQRGGPVPARDKFFVTNQPEMGDEGRLPPPLNGVGAKLQADWLKHIFRDGAKDRPYMFTRMPKFSDSNVGTLVADLALADPEPQYARAEIGVSPTIVKSTGRRLIGSQGLSCIKCHTWGNVPATGIQAIGMTTMTQRLKEAWFHRYLLDPPAFRPGTRMPSAWPMGQTFFPKLLDGDTSKQVHSLWVFLSDGDRATMPLGLGRDPIELVATTEPVIYRNFIEGAGARAIGVGYPEKVHLAFDAKDGRPALVWHGAFIDASRHWNDRGVGFQGPLGDNVLKLPDGVTLARLTQSDTAWPAAPAGQERPPTYHFRGYSFDTQRRPAFHFDVAGVRVTERYQPLGEAEQGGFKRTVLIEPGAATDNSTSEKLWLRLAVGAQIESLADGFYRVDQHARYRIASGGTPVVVKIGNQHELRLPIELRDGRGEVVVEWYW